MFGLPLYYLSMDFDLYFSPFGLVVGHVPAGEASLPLPVLKQNEPNLNL
jgi:hypothetical protein